MKNVNWNKPSLGYLKCNCDGASKGNPGESSYAFCIRKHNGDLVWVVAERFGVGTNTMAEAKAILVCLRFSRTIPSKYLILETDSLNMKNILTKEWKIPWELVDVMAEAIQLFEALNIKVEY